MLFNKLIALALGVFFWANLTFANESPEKKLRRMERDIQSLFARQASEKEWEDVLAKISVELFDPRIYGRLPNIPSACECTRLGIWSMTTKIKGGVAVVWAWIYRVVGGEKLLSLWEFEFTLIGNRWYLKRYS
ncbi:hypothetical protein A2W48_02320 [Candidatus Giovannonibacteria bacterium RIFCSPHIGHO2_12_44_12]|uniref:Uncharacterized protein n=1 Tax=Candidatus Giovannonibacteria bacterium RIFCSPHIGHO2_12_44_12 TaxID=1798340 RepID=A0A1F5WYV7_9BACT|nr:MAG: hypothetical protein A2W48_02320 [Candidatus Giovannonibacteria bacterium RIFCSPHIGHO2_12_44_12]